MRRIKTIFLIPKREKDCSSHCIFQSWTTQYSKCHKCQHWKVSKCKGLVLGVKVEECWAYDSVELWQWGKPVNIWVWLVPCSLVLNSYVPGRKTGEASFPIWEDMRIWKCGKLSPVSFSFYAKCCDGRKNHTWCRSSGDAEMRTRFWTLMVHGGAEPCVKLHIVRVLKRRRVQPGGGLIRRCSSTGLD